MYSHRELPGDPNSEVCDETEAEEIWVEALTEDAISEAEPSTAGVRIECREGCGW